MRTFTVDCSGVRSLDDFVVAFNRGFCELVGGKWSGNMDALNDYLSWPEEPSYRLILASSAVCSTALGHAAYAEWLARTLQSCHATNRAAIGERLARARQEEGPTFFEFILEILRSSPWPVVELA